MCLIESFKGMPFNIGEHDEPGGPVCGYKGHFKEELGVTHRKPHDISDRQDLVASINFIQKYRLAVTMPLCFITMSIMDSSPMGDQEWN